MIGLPPGNILQYIYLKERLNSLKKEGKSTFIEIGCGNGNVSNIFLNKGFTGKGFDLNQSACINNKEKNKDYIQSGKYEVTNGDFITTPCDEKYDIIISCMVIEHMEDELLDKYLIKCKEVLKDGGVLISYVPASMKYWGIEDDIAGHIKRYEFEDFNELANKTGLKLETISGLTYPLSNWVFGFSNKLIKKQESDKLKLDQKDRTIYTGNRDVQYKTAFPKVFNIILNPVMMYPFHFLQKLFRKNKNNMVIYCELKKV